LHIVSHLSPEYTESFKTVTGPVDLMIIHRMQTQHKYNLVTSVVCIAVVIVLQSKVRSY